MHAGIIFSNPMVLPDARPQPIRIPHGLTSPPRPPMAPASGNGTPPHQSLLAFCGRHIPSHLQTVCTSYAVRLGGRFELTPFLYAMTGGYLATTSQPEHGANGCEEAASVNGGVRPQIEGFVEVSGSSWFFIS